MKIGKRWGKRQRKRLERKKNQKRWLGRLVSSPNLLSSESSEAEKPQVFFFVRKHKNGFPLGIHPLEHPTHEASAWADLPTLTLFQLGRPAETEGEGGSDLESDHMRCHFKRMIIQLRTLRMQTRGFCFRNVGG